MIRAILPEHAVKEFPNRQKVVEGNLSTAEICELNNQFYNIYDFPNGPSQYQEGTHVDSKDIDTWRWCFVDCDLKDGTYKSKEDFIEVLLQFPLLPTKIVDSGNGIHAYWRISDLEVQSYLRLQRRLARKFKTDLAVGKICQLMRVPGFYNTKYKDNTVLCEELDRDDSRVYTCEQLDKALPTITFEDENFSKTHYNRTFNKEDIEQTLATEMPTKFHKLLADSEEVRELYVGNSSDRSGGDWRLGQLLFASHFTKEEARAVMVNCRKAMERAPQHRLSYADGIVDKIWEFESKPKEEKKAFKSLSKSVKDILLASDTEQLKGVRLHCWSAFDGMEQGFRLGHLMGLVGGSGSGKTTLALNYFYHFVRLNPEYVHMFVSLEQPMHEIALRWSRITARDERLYDKVHILGNYDEDGTYRWLSLDEIEEYVIEYQKREGVKVGALVIDHVGVLRQTNKKGEFEGLRDVCGKLKSVAMSTHTFLVAQSQSSRSAAGEGDIELNKGSAWGTSVFENFCDALLVTWQPLRRVLSRDPKMTITAYKYCKIRHRNVLKDHIKEDEVYLLHFDPNTERLRKLTQEENIDFKKLDAEACKLKSRDLKKASIIHTDLSWVKDEEEGATNVG